LSNESAGIYFLYPRNFIIKLLSGGLSKRDIVQVEIFLHIFLNFFNVLSLCIYLMYYTVDSVSSQLNYIIYARSNIYAIPEWPCNSAMAWAIPVWHESGNGPEHVYIEDAKRFDCGI